MTQSHFIRAATKSASTLIRRILIGRVPKLFDGKFYLQNNRDVAASGIDPFLHYVWRGASQNRDAAEDFDTAFFRDQSGPTRLDPVRHYIRFGAAAGLDPNPGFSSASYLIRYPDIAASGVNPLLHYRTNGRLEGRVAKPSASKTLEIACLRAVPSRHIHNLPSKPGHPFSITLLPNLQGDEQYKPARRLCYFLRLTHDEIALLVNALETTQANCHAEITLDVDTTPDPSSATDRKAAEVSPHMRPTLNTLLAAFENCYASFHDDTAQIRYAELRLWDLRETEARVAEIFPAGAVRICTRSHI
ncbi:hypothetical protein [Methylobacterium sp. WL7]|uniref:hypothetical protein n=1 Tax=Methylobacterium sp. WL7 TaxID=2603900 RepID=UPI0011C9C0AD|nr:hypothetical protein [Methylobacterium sp. WL7]TXN42529.1 hypothetical protein FV233_22305 [Methylobacterium sp. WL7]